MDWSLYELWRYREANPRHHKSLACEGLVFLLRNTSRNPEHWPSCNSIYINTESNEDIARHHEVNPSLLLFFEEWFVSRISDNDGVHAYKYVKNTMYAWEPGPYLEPQLKLLHDSIW